MVPDITPVIDPIPIDDPAADLITGVDLVPSFSEARLSVYEAHGWWTLVAWFPLGFALIATQRYYKTPWKLMHHLHNLIGLSVTAATLYTCIVVYDHVNWV